MSNKNMEYILDTCLDNFNSGKQVDDLFFENFINNKEELDFYVELLEKLRIRFDESLKKLENKKKHTNNPITKKKAEIFIESFVNKMRREFQKDLKNEEKNLEKIKKKLIIDDNSGAVYSL